MAFPPALAVLVCAPAFTQAEAPPPVLPLPPGWTQERFEFPIRFAPTLPYAGVEELRFSPNAFKRGTRDYYAYAMLWWVVGNPPVTAASLELDLAGYYQGLMTSVGKSKGVVVDPGATHAAVKALGGGRFRAFVNTLDAFNGGAPLELILDVEVTGPTKGHRALFFAVAPAMAEREVREGVLAVVKQARSRKR